MPKAEDYRRLAAECLDTAESVHEPRLKTALIDKATVWLHLAQQAEKNRHADLVYETPSKRRHA